MFINVKKIISKNIFARFFNCASYINNKNSRSTTAEKILFILKLFFIIIIKIIFLHNLLSGFNMVCHIIVYNISKKNKSLLILILIHQLFIGHLVIFLILNLYNSP